MYEMTFDPPILLEFGSGDRPFEDGRKWIHQDMRKRPGIDLICKAESITSYIKPGTCEELRATHLLEHFSYRKTVAILKKWATLLVPGGSIYLEVPNLEWQARAFVAGEISASDFVYYAYGEQDHPGNYHYAAFDEGLLRKTLLEAGYTVVGLTNIGQVLCAKAVK